MYCKHCGKEISDDSVFCKFCGGKQEDCIASRATDSEHVKSPKDNVKKDTLSEFRTILKKSSYKAKFWLWGFSAWFVLNLYCLCAEVKLREASEYYYDYPDSEGEYGPWFYSFAEFVLCVIGVPVIIWGIKLLINYRKSKKM